MTCDVNGCDTADPKYRLVNDSTDAENSENAGNTADICGNCVQIVFAEASNNGACVKCGESADYHLNEPGMQPGGVDLSESSQMDVSRPLSNEVICDDCFEKLGV